MTTPMSYTRGSIVIHNEHGAGTIISEEVVEVGGVSVTCYTINIHITDGIIRVPTTAAASVLRSPSADPAKVKEVVKIMSGTPVPLKRSWHITGKKGSNELRRKLASGDLTEIAEVFRDLRNQESFTAIRWREEALGKILTEVYAARGDTFYEDTLAHLQKLSKLTLTMPTTLMRVREDKTVAPKDLVVTGLTPRPVREGFQDSRDVPSEAGLVFQRPPAPHNLPKVDENNVVVPTVTPKPEKKKVSRPKRVKQRTAKAPPAIKPESTPTNETPTEATQEKRIVGVAKRKDGTWGPVYE